MLALPFLVFAAQTAVAQPAPPPPPACAAPEHRQFDFWVGRWDVYPTGKNTLVAHSLIEKLYGGCTVRENWMPLKGTGGGSLNMYDPADRRWHQTWHDSTNARVEFEGELKDGKMVLTGHWKGVNGPGKDGTVRMTYSREAAGAVRQHGEVTTDKGATWTTSFDFTYKPAATPK
jgi:hypothetical protein